MYAYEVYVCMGVQLCVFLLNWTLTLKGFFTANTYKIGNKKIFINVALLNSKRLKAGQLAINKAQPRCKTRGNQETFQWVARWMAWPLYHQITSPAPIPRSQIVS